MLTSRQLSRATVAAASGRKSRDTATKTLPEIVTIEQKFLEPGHTHMEVDAMHATIDHHRKKLNISSPDEWPVVLQTARRGGPYTVREM